MVRVRDGDIECHSLVKHLIWWLEDAPGGSMDNDGFLQFKAAMSEVAFYLTKGRFHRTEERE